ncbi:hypothetical protein Enr17x_02190 [Gimesia fumaroli]|uniref:Uncharacterized protein n=1 Tax=Gimesia fumaroli TaxID=2527976 RepID=A0A518I588_9PLAN|nr:hypothetical protein Enr17x_02190 [Gimesia fumaroli]
MRALPKSKVPSLEKVDELDDVNLGAAAEAAEEAEEAANAAKNLLEKNKGAVTKSIPATKELADEIASVGLPRSRQTVVLIETAEGKTIIAAGGPDLTAAQKTLARGKGLLVADDLPGFHAEMTAVATAGEKGLLPIRGVTTNKMCRDGSSSCFNQLSEMAKRGGYELKVGPDGRSFEFIKIGE